MVQTRCARTPSTLQPRRPSGGTQVVYVSKTVTIQVGHATGVFLQNGNTPVLEATLWGNETHWADERIIVTGTRNHRGDPGASVILDGGNRTDPDGHLPLTYWSR